MRGVVRSAVGVSALAICGAAWAGNVGGSVAGSWSGEMRQIDPTTETSYPMTLSLTAGGARGVSAYPTLHCKGRWTRLAQKDGYSVFYEKVTNEPGASCVDGIVSAKVDRGKLVVGWFGTFEGEPTLASAVLASSFAK